MFVVLCICCGICVHVYFTAGVRLSVLIAICSKDQNTIANQSDATFSPDWDMCLRAQIGPTVD